uniref:Uncharacterized protein n=1 Tax=Noctiluca scintillans TaxID=2966 RepID=A0A7S0ZUD8_NOCSC
MLSSRMSAMCIFHLIFKFHLCTAVRVTLFAGAKSKISNGYPPRQNFAVAQQKATLANEQALERRRLAEETLELQAKAKGAIKAHAAAELKQEHQERKAQALKLKAFDAQKALQERQALAKELAHIVVVLEHEVDQALQEYEEAEGLRHAAWARMEEAKSLAEAAAEATAKRKSSVDGMALDAESWAVETEYLEKQTAAAAQALIDYKAAVAQSEAMKEAFGEEARKLETEAAVAQQQGTQAPAATEAAADTKVKASTQGKAAQDQGRKAVDAQKEAQAATEETRSEEQVAERKSQESASSDKTSAEAVHASEESQEAKGIDDQEKVATSEQQETVEKDVQEPSEVANEADKTESAREPADEDAVREEETAETAEVAQDTVAETEGALGSESRSEALGVEKEVENVGQDDTAAQEQTDAVTPESREGEEEETDVEPETGDEQNEETAVQSVSAKDTNAMPSAATLPSSMALLLIAVARCVV